MEDDMVAASPATSSIPENEFISNIIEEGLRICPLCSSEVRLFYIHFNEQMLMCENTECDFPFGHEEIKFVRVETEEEMNDTTTIRSKNRTVSPASSVVSTQAWSEIDKMDRVCEAEDNLDPKALNMPTKKLKASRKVLSNMASEKRIQKNIEDIKGLNWELNQMTTRRKFLKNEKWIKSLMQLQDQSGKQLLEPEEIKKVVNKPETNTKELKIDIAPGNSSCMSSIKIEITNQSKVVI